MGREVGQTLEKILHSVLKYNHIELARYFVQSQNAEFFSKYAEQYNKKNCRSLILRGTNTNITIVLLI